MKKEICCLFNLAALYREPIYKLMDEHLKCDFYITKWKKAPFKEMNYDSLNGYKGSGKKIELLGGFYWQTNTIGLLFKPYRKYILTGEPYSVSTWVMLILAKIIGKKTFLWSHGWYGRESYIKRVMKLLFFKLCTGGLLYGDYAKQLMIERGIKKEKLHCIYNSLDYDKQLQVRKTGVSTNVYSEHFQNNFPVLVYIGRIQKIKKVDMILDALINLNKKEYPCNLIIIGADNEKICLDKKVEELNLKKQVWLYGPCYSENKLGELIHNASLCVSPGNVGLTAMHSLVYGTPVLTHDNFENQMPEFEAIKENVSGSFFIEDSIEDLSLKIELWTDKTAQERAVIRKACYKIIDEKYNPYFQLELIKKVLA